MRPCMFNATRGKEPPKKAVFDNSWLFLTDLALLAVPKEHGHTPNQEKHIHMEILKCRLPCDPWTRVASVMNNKSAQLPTARH